MTNDRKAEPGKPGMHAGKRVRWRHVWRETRKTNRPAVAALIDRERAMKEQFVRRATILLVIRNALIAAAALGFLAWRCSL